MSVINTNVSALIAQSALTSNSRAQSTAMQQLSTGLRINGAKDDAAGLAIASKMTSQIRGLDQSVRNANDGISMLQTADGALVAVGDMLQRMREISVQSASDTNVTTDRQALNTEFLSLKTEINRVSATTQWNGMNILDGKDTDGFTFQIGANNSADQRITQTIKSSDVKVANTGTATVVSTPGVVDAVTAANQTTQSSTLTLSGTMVAGDKISAMVGGKSFDYTVIATDVAGTDTQNLTTVAASMAAAYTALSPADSAHAATSSGAGFILKATALGAGANTSAMSAGVVTFQGVGDSTSILKQGDAQSAIDLVDKTLATVNATRAGLGATINRLTYAADNLTNVSQNTSASRSRVQDTDYAKASTELARTQIISQAATAMLAQANQSQQSVLALLK